MQEIAMNVVWTEEEYKSMTDGHLDYDTTMTDQTVCKVSLCSAGSYQHILISVLPFLFEI